MKRDYVQKFRITKVTGRFVIKIKAKRVIELYRSENSARTRKAETWKIYKF